MYSVKAFIMVACADAGAVVIRENLALDQ